MSPRPGVSYAVVLVLVANLAPLAGWWWNRMGAPRATVELSEREVGVRWGNDEDTSVWLELWRADAWEPRVDPAWADSAALVGLGFEAARLSTGEAERLAAWRPARRPAWVLLRLEAAEASPMEGSRLVPVAVGTDPGALYRQANDPALHLVARGVVRVGRAPLPADSVSGLGDAESWTASLDLITPARIHVPRSLIPALEDLAAGTPEAGAPRFEVRLHLGRLHLPWITAVFPTTP